jgi:hypothetical protein
VKNSFVDEIPLLLIFSRTAVNLKCVVIKNLTKKTKMANNNNNRNPILSARENVNVFFKADQTNAGLTAETKNNERYFPLRKFILGVSRIENIFRPCDLFFCPLTRDTGMAIIRIFNAGDPLNPLLDGLIGKHLSEKGIPTSGEFFIVMYHFDTDVYRLFWTDLPQDIGEIKRGIDEIGIFSLEEYLAMTKQQYQLKYNVEDVFRAEMSVSLPVETFQMEKQQCISCQSPTSLVRVCRHYVCRFCEVESPKCPCGQNI